MVLAVALARADVVDYISTDMAMRNPSACVPFCRHQWPADPSLARGWVSLQFGQGEFCIVDQQRAGCRARMIYEIPCRHVRDCD